MFPLTSALLEARRAGLGSLELARPRAKRLLGRPRECIVGALLALSRFLRLPLVPLALLLGSREVGDEDLQGLEPLEPEPVLRPPHLHEVEEVRDERGGRLVDDLARKHREEPLPHLGELGSLLLVEDDAAPLESGEDSVVAHELGYTLGRLEGRGDELRLIHHLLLDLLPGPRAESLHCREEQEVIPPRLVGRLVADHDRGKVALVDLPPDLLLHHGDGLDPRVLGGELFAVTFCRTEILLSHTHTTPP